MGDKVTPLFGGPTGEPKPNKTCIEELEKLLEMAKSGEVVGVAWAELHCDGTANYAAAGLIGGFSMIGALETVKSIIMEENRDE